MDSIINNLSVRSSCYKTSHAFYVQWMKDLISHLEFMNESIFRIQPTIEEQLETKCSLIPATNNLKLSLQVVIEEDAINKIIEKKYDTQSVAFCGNFNDSIKSGLTVTPKHMNNKLWHTITALDKPLANFFAMLGIRNPNRMLFFTDTFWDWYILNNTAYFAGINLPPSSNFNVSNDLNKITTEEYIWNINKFSSNAF